MVLLDFLPLFPHFFILAYFSRLLGDIPFSPAPPSIALKSSSDNEMTLVPINCCPHHHHAEHLLHISGWALIANKPGSGQLPWYLFIYLCPSTPNLMKTGVAVTWGGFEFPNTVLLQPVNSLVIAALQEEKKTFYPQKSKWQQK